MTDTDARLIERLPGIRNAARELRDFWVNDSGTSIHLVAADRLDEAAARIESLTAELEHFIDIVDGTETTGFDPHVEQMLMDAAESARAALGDSK